MRRALVNIARAAGAACIASCGALLAASPCLAQVRDADMKAAYVYNFAQFTTWPAERARPVLAVCADRASVLGQALQAYQGRQVGGRTWHVLDSAGRPGSACDILVLPRAADSGTGAGNGDGILVVRDGAGRGAAAITLVDDDEQLRFDIDTREAARAGLRISSKLLRLARNVQ